MGLSLFPIPTHLLWCVGGRRDLETINGNLLSKLVKQVSIEAGRTIASARMGEETDRAAPVGRVADFGQIFGDPEETGVRDELASRGFACAVAQLL